MQLTMVVHVLSVNRFTCVLDGVLGCELPNGSFVEESNFYISSVKMKIKISNVEAGWIVTVSDVVEEEEK